jgi:hypothetical protein
MAAMYYTIIIGSLSAVTPLSNASEDLITWLFFTIVLPLTPLLLSYTALIIFVRRNTHWKEFVDLVKNGELFFFTTALAATSLNKLHELPPSISIPSLVQIALWAMLLLSTYCFGLTVHNKLDQTPLNLRVSLSSIQYRLNRHISRQTGNIGNMESELREITNQLADLQTMATKTGALLKHAKNPLQNPSRPNLTGTRERVWGITSIAIFFTILVCLLSYEVYLYGGS